MESLHNLWRTGQRPGRQQDGFSLTELVIVIAIIGILAAIAIPAMVSSYPDYQLKEAARNMLSNFQKAKLEAVRRNARVTVTFNQPVAGTIFDYVIFVDRNPNHIYEPALFPVGDAVPPNVDKTILVQENLARYGGGVRAVLPADPAPNDPNTFGLNADATPLPCFTFTPRGLPKDVAGLGAAGRVRLTNRKGARRNVEMNAMGGLTVTR